jgi:hypothetical protein
MKDRDLYIGMVAGGLTLMLLAAVEFGRWMGKDAGYWEGFSEGYNTSEEHARGLICGNHWEVQRADYQ